MTEWLESDAMNSSTHQPSADPGSIPGRVKLHLSSARGLGGLDLPRATEKRRFKITLGGELKNQQLKQ